jgi:uncharacterized membrane protein
MTTTEIAIGVVVVTLWAGWLTYRLLPAIIYIVTFRAFTMESRDKFR